MHNSIFVLSILSDLVLHRCASKACLFTNQKQRMSCLFCDMRFIIVDERQPQNFFGEGGDGGGVVAVSIGFLVVVLLFAVCSLVVYVFVALLVCCFNVVVVVVVVVICCRYDL